MREVPERIWAFLNGPFVGMFVSGGIHDGGTEYVRADLAPQWQRIETAPKDGERFLAYEPGAEPPHYECWWQDDFPNWSGWQTDWDNEPEPTHWQPLPAPPTPEQS